MWRFGLGGIGFSSNGYEGPFEVAITMDGQINADFIRLFFKSKIYRNQISELSNGANINNIKTEDIDSLIINIPELSIQEKAVKDLTILNNALDSKKLELSHLDELIKSRFIGQEVLQCN